eukprot:12724-Heterococcus_DN1.PRE.3
MLKTADCAATELIDTYTEMLADALASANAICIADDTYLCLARAACSAGKSTLGNGDSPPSSSSC